MSLSKNARERIDSIGGIHQRIIMKQDDDIIASSLYVCESKETAVKIQNIMQVIMSETKDMAPFYSEWIYEILDYAKYT
jgi:hypothetical protein